MSRAAVIAELITAPFSIVFLLVCFISFLRRMCNDLKTPNKTNGTVYKAAQIATALMSFFGLLYSVSTIGVNIATLGGDGLDDLCIVALIGNSAISVVKLLLYYIYELRLHLIYGNTQYRRSPLYQFGTGAFISLYAAVILVWPIDAVTTKQYDSWRNMDKNSCGVVANDYFILMAVLFDLAFNGMYVYLFMMPLRAILTSVTNSNVSGAQKQKVQRKVLVHSLKTFILCSTLFVASLLSGFIYVILGYNAFLISICFDVACAKLMSPYYPDKSFFNKICRCCIVVCDRHNYIGSAEKGVALLPGSGGGQAADVASESGGSPSSASSGGDAGKEQSRYESVQTDDAIAFAARTFNGGGGNANLRPTSSVENKLAASLE